MIYSFNAGSLVPIWEGFASAGTASAWHNEEFHDAAENTLIISVTATIVSTIVATLAAIGMTAASRGAG